jgi:hypothetical protein
MHTTVVTGYSESYVRTMKETAIHKNTVNKKQTG